MTTLVLPSLFNGLDPSGAEAIIALGTVKRLRAGEVLFALGDAADELYLIERGRVAMTLPVDVCGRDEDVLVEEQQAGGTVGWSALIPPHRFTLKASAVCETAVLALPRAALLAHFERHPQAAHMVSANVAAVIGHRLQVLQAMWLREMNRAIASKVAASNG
jgi:CRP-like cAMP-binding protein